MPHRSPRTLVFVSLAVLAIAVVLVDDRWIRIGIVLVPAFLLARGALNTGVAHLTAAAETAARRAKAEADRRSDLTVRKQIQDLLTLIRDFYTTCHMVAVGQLEPSKAKAKAQTVERQLNAMMEHMLRQVEVTEDGSGADRDGGAGPTSQGEETS